MDAEATDKQVPKTLNQNGFGAMRTIYEAKYPELCNDRVPVRAYLEKKLSEIENPEELQAAYFLAAPTSSSR